MSALLGVANSCNDYFVNEIENLLNTLPSTQVHIDDGNGSDRNVNTIQSQLYNFRCPPIEEQELIGIF